MNQVILQPLKGFRDFLPDEARKRKLVISKVSQIFELFGFEPLETPALEYQELLLGKYGQEAEKLVYKFKDNGGRDVALRYDQTVPTARILAMYHQKLAMPWRRYQIQPVWRADKPQKGRYREITHCDADIFGSKSAISDAECIALADQIFAQLGFGEYKIYLNDRNILFDIINFVSIPQELQFSVIASIDKLDRKTKEEVADELRQKGINELTIKHLFDHLDNATPTQSLLAVMKHCQELGVPKDKIIFEARLARGLDYYTSTIFEIKIDNYLGGSVLGGGRYDHLIKKLCGVDIPAVGFALGLDRTIDAMNQFGLFPQDKSATKVLVSVFSRDLIDESAIVVANLRENNINAEIYPSEDTRLDKQLKYADKKGIRFLVVIGPEEVKKNKVILKDLQTGKQEDTRLMDLPSKIKSL